MLMVTYRKDRARKHWHRPWLVRILLVIMGLVLLLAGAIGWGLEEVYGGDSDRQEYVIGYEDGRGVVYGQDGAVVFESTDLVGAEAYVANQRGSRNYSVPIVLLALVGLAILAGISPSPLKQELRPARPSTAGPAAV